MKDNSQSGKKETANKYDHLFLGHRDKQGYFGKYVDFEGGHKFNTSMSALYLIVRDTRPNGDTPHSHDFDEYLSFVGLDPENPKELGAEIDLYIGKEQEKHSFNKTTTIYIPKGLWHLPLVFNKVEKPFMLVHLFMTPAYNRNE